ncbi:hypothetical protein NG800_014755 [Epilithonimonas ginsengisoli]|uniref:DUF3592 domain-containing protein n=1 Tax=Epilithonimonas ginsengisoli TaxID=1245592 RepID=A0ABU4JKF4_9FLAO|nr:MULTISPECIES: hypothetical protein [Chryseobacterium group]MBV6881217.1 hypothetical protein [Epilithonimonas sp. FP105]MDW8550185.1 hypothetical protein [Epilithonimonas ginsengisoli]OAH70606.1 hypothetical protein AXA65_12885 [Chryseobacterium sp. FP211-J200]
MSFKTFVILLSIVGIFYIPGKILISNSDLIEVKATVTEVRKSGNRVPYYKFKTKEYPGVFYNSGNGMLSYFKNDEAILKNSINKKLTFYINENENLENDDDKFYVALNSKSKWTDLFYYNIRSFTKFFFAIFCLFLLIINTIAIYRYKMKLFEISFMVYLALFFLVLGL